MRACLMPLCVRPLQGHGSHVSGIAAGAIHGVAKAATIHPVKVGRRCGWAAGCSAWLGGLGRLHALSCGLACPQLPYLRLHPLHPPAPRFPLQVMGDDGSGSYSNIIAGMNWVRQHVQRNGWRGVVNMSLGGELAPPHSHSRRGEHKLSGRA